MGDLMSSSNCKNHPKNSFDPANFGSKSFWDQNIFFNPKISETKTVFRPRKFYPTIILCRPTINLYWPNSSWVENSKKNLSPELIDNLQIIGTRKFLEAHDIFWTKNVLRTKIIFRSNFFVQNFCRTSVCQGNKILLYQIFVGIILRP